MGPVCVVPCSAVAPSRAAHLLLPTCSSSTQQATNFLLGKAAVQALAPAALYLAFGLMLLHSGERAGVPGRQGGEKWGGADARLRRASEPATPSCSPVVRLLPLPPGRTAALQPVEAGTLAAEAQALVEVGGWGSTPVRACVHVAPSVEAPPGAVQQRRAALSTRLLPAPLSCPVSDAGTYMQAVCHAHYYTHSSAPRATLPELCGLLGLLDRRLLVFLLCWPAVGVPHRHAAALRGRCRRVCGIDDWHAEGIIEVPVRSPPRPRLSSWPLPPPQLPSQQRSPRRPSPVYSLMLRCCAL